MEATARASSLTCVLDASDVRRAVTRIAHEITERNHGSAGLVLVGIHTRGVPLAHRLAGVIARVEGEVPPVGALDISLFRDDLALRPTGRMGGTDLPVDPTGATVVLVDDVLYTGRSIRAALEALHHLGRPAAVQLAVLVDRGHRELPIRPDYVGKNLPTAVEDRIRVRLEEVDGEDGVWVQR